MNISLQNICWRNLPKEARDEIKEQYKRWNCWGSTFKNEIISYQDLFGEHNLTSGCEPPEMLHVEREKVNEMYFNALKDTKRENVSESIINLSFGSLNAIKILFGDKCMPERDRKYDFGQKVRLISSGRLGIIDNIDGYDKEDDTYYYNVQYNDNSSIGCLPEEELEPYTEQSDALNKPFDIGDKVRVTGIKKYAGQVTEIVAVDDSDSIAPYKLDLLDDEEDSIWCGGNVIELFTEPETKDNVKQVRKLKPIDEMVVVFLSTKEEETEFRTLLNENGYKWASGLPLIDVSYWISDSVRMIHFVYPEKFVTYSGSRDNSITFSDFKEKYLEPESRNLSQETVNRNNHEDNYLKNNIEEKDYPPYLDRPKQIVPTMEEKELKPDEDFKMGDDVYKDDELLGKFICYSYSEHYKEVMVDVLIDSGKDREINQGGWFAKDVSKTPQKPKMWIPKNGEGFWYINNLLKPISRFYHEEDPEDNDMISVGNCFQTYELCKQAIKSMGVYRDVSRKEK